MFLVQIDGHIKGDVLEKAQELLGKVLGYQSNEPTVIYHYSSEGAICPFVTHETLPPGIDVGEFMTKYEVTGNETPENPTTSLFTIPSIGEHRFSRFFEVKVIGLIRGYNEDGTELYET